jgi:hypothetical protein
MAKEFLVSGAGLGKMYKTSDPTHLNQSILLNIVNNYTR